MSTGEESLSRETEEGSPRRACPSSITGVANGGEYAEHSLIQQLAFEEEIHPRAVRWLREYCARRRAGARVVIADHGCADGLTFCKLLRELEVAMAVDGGYGGDGCSGGGGRNDDGDGTVAAQHVTAIFQDLPGNDWDAAGGTLASIMGGELQPEERLPDLLLDLPSSPSLFSFVERRGSFYAQLLSDESVDLSVSGSSYHWLSSVDDLPRPSRSDNGLCLDSSRFPPSVKSEWSKRSAEDWSTILRHRCAELRPGGMFLAIVPCSPCMPHAIVVLEEVFAEFEERGLVREGASIANFVIPVYLDRTDGDLRDGFAGLPMKVITCEVKPRRNPYLPPDGVFRDDGDKREFGRRMAGWCFGWGARLIEDAVGLENVAEFRDRLAEEFYRQADDPGLQIGMGCGVVLADKAVQ